MRTPTFSAFSRPLALLAAVGIAALPGCNKEAADAAAVTTDAAQSTDSSAGETASADSGGSTSPCSFALVKVQTGKDSACGGGNSHLWPIGMAKTDCHGWSSTDTTGKQHNNSAADIRCNADGSFSFVQYAGNLDCSGSGVLKTYKANVCTQDTPPTLYSMAFDLTCCSQPTSAACQKGVPSVTVPGTTIYLNGKVCGG